MELVTYTALTDCRDTLREPEVVTDNVRYVCLYGLVRPPAVTGWELLPMPADVLASLPDPVRQARWCKIEGYKSLGGDHSIWMDATYCPRFDMQALVHRHLMDFDIAAFPHFERSCIYEEAATVLANKLDDPALVHRQMERLRADGYPRWRGLFDTSVLVRRHTPRIAALSELWWETVCAGSRRDQLSFNYVLWRLDISCNLLRPGLTRKCGSVWDTYQPYFSAIFHRIRAWSPA